MADDDKPPPQPPTMKMPAMTDRALLEDLARTTRGIRDEVGELRNEVDIAVSQGKSMNLRLSRVEEKVDELDGRVLRNSSRVRAPSEHDLAAQAELAKERGAREALEKKVDVIEKKTDDQTVKLDSLAEDTKKQTAILEKLENGASKVLANPTVRLILMMAGTAIVAWLGAHGGVK